MKKVDAKRVAKAFARALGTVARALDKHESAVTKAEFFANHDGVEPTEWEIRKSGGYTSLRNMLFPPDESNLEIRYGSKLVSQHIAKVEREHGRAMFYERELFSAVKEALKDHPLVIHPPLPKPAASKARTSRSLVGKLSDLHFGANISKGEMHGLNEFNWTIAARRLAFFMEQLVLYKRDKRKDTDLVLQLNGDIIAGLIHNQEWFVDLLTTQFVGALHLLAQAISYVARHFAKVRVVCTVGNHGRNNAKSEKGRATTNKWDAFESMLYFALQAVLAEKHHNVEFLIPEAPFALYKVQGHWVFQTHGDTVINVGNPGKSLNMGSIADQINRVSSSELIPANEKVEIVTVGHVHTATAQLLESGCMLMINGCLSGTDPFAQSIGIHASNPTQIMFESTKRHAVGDIRLVQLKGADHEARLDRIVAARPSPFPGEGVKGA